MLQTKQTSLLFVVTEIKHACENVNFSFFWSFIRNTSKSNKTPSQKCNQNIQSNSSKLNIVTSNINIYLTVLHDNKISNENNMIIIYKHTG